MTNLKNTYNNKSINRWFTDTYFIVYQQSPLLFLLKLITGIIYKKIIGFFFNLKMLAS